MSKLEECLELFTEKVKEYRQSPFYRLNYGNNEEKSIEFWNIENEKCDVYATSNWGDNYASIMLDVGLSDIRILLVGLKLNHLITEKALALMFEAEGI